MKKKKKKKKKKKILFILLYRILDALIFITYGNFILLIKYNKIYF